MSKMKQATLFSLKSWKKAVTEDVLKYKNVLERENLSETVILKTLACLKQKKITKESISSAGIGEILTTLAKGSNLKVAYEARALIKYWNLDISLNQKFDNVSVYETETQADIEIIECTDIESTMNVCTPDIECNKTVKVQTNKLNPKLCSIDKSHLDAHQVKDELFEKKLSDGFNEKEITYLKSEEKSLVRIPNKELKRRLGKALELFTQALGEQEVKFYLYNTRIWH